MGKLADRREEEGPRKNKGALLTASGQSRGKCLSQTHWGLDVELSLFSSLELGLLTRGGWHVLALGALSGPVALFLHPSPCHPTPTPAHHHTQVVLLPLGLVGTYKVWRW